MHAAVNISALSTENQKWNAEKKKQHKNSNSYKLHDIPSYTEGTYRFVCS